MKILFYSDGSLQAEKAVRFGAPIAAACQAEVFILGIAAKPEGEKALLRALRSLQDICQEIHLEAELITKVGKPGREIINHTKETPYDLLVIGGVRHNPLWWALDPLWKSVRAYKIIESVEPHVLVVIGQRPGLRRILLCTDGSETLDQAVEFTGQIAQSVQAVVDLFHVMPEMPTIYTDLIRLEEHVDRVLQSNSRLGRTLRHQKDLLKRMGVLGKVRLRHGLLVPELKKELQQSDYDLVVSGSSLAEERLRKYIKGDTTREIVNHSELPV